MPWPLTASVCLCAGAIIGFFLADCLATVTIAEANRRAFNAQAEADHQRDLADKWKRVAHPNVTDQVANIEAGRILREQRRQQGGFHY
jgi:hypothetical protein